MGRCGEGRGGRRSRAEGKRVERVAAGGEGVGEVGDLREGEGERGGRRGEECGERGEEEEALDDPEQLEAEHQFHLDQTAWKSEIIRINILIKKSTDQSLSPRNIGRGAKTPIVE